MVVFKRFSMTWKGWDWSSWNLNLKFWPSWYWRFWALSAPWTSGPSLPFMPWRGGKGPAVWGSSSRAGWRLLSSTRWLIGQGLWVSFPRKRECSLNVLFCLQATHSCIMQVFYHGIHQNTTSFWLTDPEYRIMWFLTFSSFQVNERQERTWRRRWQFQ